MRRFLEGFLPARLSAVLDYNSLEDSKETFLTPGLKKSMGDLVFRCRSQDGDEGSIYILFEHKSHPDHFCAGRVLRYMALIWEDALKTPGKKKLPFIIPIVFYHGKEQALPQGDMTMQTFTERFSAGLRAGYAGGQGGR